MNKENPFLMDFISKLINKDIPINEVYKIIGLSSILSSYKLRKELNEFEYYQVIGGNFPDNLQETEIRNISEDSSNLQLSESALKKYNEYLIQSLSEILNEPNLNNNFSQILSELEEEVLKINPEDIKLNGFYTTLYALDVGIIIYEDIGKEIVSGKTKISSLDIY